MVTLWPQPVRTSREVELGSVLWNWRRPVGEFLDANRPARRHTDQDHAKSRLARLDVNAPHWRNGTERPGLDIRGMNVKRIEFTSPTGAAVSLDGRGRPVEVRDYDDISAQLALSRSNPTPPEPGYTGR